MALILIDKLGALVHNREDIPYFGECCDKVKTALKVVIPISLLVSVFSAFGGHPLFALMPLMSAIVGAGLLIAMPSKSLFVKLLELAVCKANPQFKKVCDGCASSSYCSGYIIETCMLKRAFYEAFK